MPVLWLVLVSGTSGFCRFRLGAGSDCLPWGPPSWTGSEIGPRDWIWSGFVAIAGCRLAGHSPGTARFRRFWIGVCCFRSSLRWCSRTDSEIGRRIRNQSAHGMWTFRRVRQGVAEYCGSRVMRAGFAYSAGRVSGLNRESGDNIGFSPCGGVVIAVVLACLGFGNYGIPPFLDWCGLRPLPDRLFPRTGSEIGPRDWIWSGFGAVAGLAAGWSQSGNRGIPPF